MPIPLFIKVPNQHKGVVSDRNVETIDILPTIADILGIELPWPIDGHSALDPSLSERKKKVIFKDSSHERFVFDPGLEAKYITLKRKLSLFGSGKIPDGLFKIGPYKDIVGQRISDIATMEEGGYTVQLDQEGLYSNVDPSSEFVLSHITGRVISIKGEVPRLNLAIGINGVIYAVTKTFAHHRHEATLSVLVPEEAFRAGRNDVQSFIVTVKPNGQPTLTPTRRQLVITYSISASERDGEILIRHTDGASVPIVPNALNGWLDFAVVQRNHVLFYGWAADVEKSQLPEAIVVFVNGRFLYSGRTGVDRPGVVKFYDNAALQKARFKDVIPLSPIKDRLNPEVRFFAVLNGVASALNYNKGYHWIKKS